jgi:hypothetical protein
MGLNSVIWPPIKIGMISMRTALFLAAFSLALIGGTYSHGPKTLHSHMSESTNATDHAHMEIAIDVDLSNDILHCGIDILQFAQSSSAPFVRNPTRILSLEFRMGKNLWFGLEPPPPKLFS